MPQDEKNVLNLAMFARLPSQIVQKWSAKSVDTDTRFWTQSALTPEIVSTTGSVRNPTVLTFHSANILA